MTQESASTLLRAYRMAIEAGQETIADMLEDVVLDEMDKSRDVPITIHGISDGGAVKPPWNVMDTPLKTQGIWVGIDPLTHTATAKASDAT